MISRTRRIGADAFPGLPGIAFGEVSAPGLRVAHVEEARSSRHAGTSEAIMELHT